MPILTTPATQQTQADPSRQFMMQILRRTVRPTEMKVPAWNIMFLSSRRSWHDIDPVCESAQVGLGDATKRIVSLRTEGWLKDGSQERGWTDARVCAAQCVRPVAARAAGRSRLGSHVRAGSAPPRSRVAGGVRRAAQVGVAMALGTAHPRDARSSMCLILSQATG